MFTVCIICFRDFFLFFFFKDTATTEIYTYRHTLSLHDALPLPRPGGGVAEHRVGARQGPAFGLFIKLHRGRDTDCRQELRSALKPHLAHGVIGPTTDAELQLALEGFQSVRKSEHSSPVWQHPTRCFLNSFPGFVSQR